MVVNCLPLYEPPPFEGEGAEEEEQGANSTDSPSGSAAKSASLESESPKRKFTLIKAKSVEALDSVAAELELHDQDHKDYKSEGESYSRTVQAAPRKWSRMSASYSKNLKVMVHNVDHMPPPNGVGLENGWAKKEESLPGRAEEAEGAEGERVNGGPVSEAVGKEGEGENEKGAAQDSEDGGVSVAKESTAVANREENGRADEEVGGDSGEGGGSEGKPDTELSTEISSDTAESTAEQSQPKPKQAASSKKGKKPLRQVKSSSPIGSELDNGSDGENEKSLTVNYLDTNTMSTLKRSSGSVSFYYRTEQRPTSPSAAVEASIEESAEDEDSGAANSAIAKTTVIVETKGYYSGTDTNPSAPPPSALTTLPDPVLAPSLLPDAPPTLDQEYLERSGWLNKLSHRKGVFGDKWQKRYFVLHRSWLYYFKKYGVSKGT